MIKFKIKFEITFVKLQLKSYRSQETSMAASSGYNASDVPVPQDSSSSIVAFTTFNETNENEMKT